MSEVDRLEAYDVGSAAVYTALSGRSGSMVSIQASREPSYRSHMELVPLSGVANAEKTFPLEWIGDGNRIADEFFDYALPLIGGELPQYAILR